MRGVVERSRVAHLVLSLLLLTVGLVACIEPAQERAELDRRMGRASADGVSLVIGDGLGTFHVAEPGRVVAWVQAPSITLELGAEVGLPSSTTWRIELLNIMSDALLTGRDALSGVEVEVRLVERPRATAGVWEVELRAGQRLLLQLAPPDADTPGAFRYAVLSDVQRAMDEVQDVFSRMNEDPSLRFVVSSGDLGNQGYRSELRRFQRELAQLRVPFYSTVGNHELGTDPEVWAELFGPFNFSFNFKGVRFTLVDSGNATIDPLVYERLDGWLAAGRDQVHTFVTHIPPIDPVGQRNGSFRNRREAAKLLVKLAEGLVDVTFYGHIHSYYAFENAGIPAYISGGGGALPERIDGIGRHYLVVDVDPASAVQEVSIVRVD